MSISRHSLILASSSPRRLDLMREAGLMFEVIPAEVEETHEESAPPGELTRLNAALKAGRVAAQHPDRTVIGADTLVAIDGKVLGKPEDFAEARRMLTRLTGRTHEVCTAVCLENRSLAAKREFQVITRVTFLPLTAEKIVEYLRLINPLDKAGGYAAQEHGDKIIERVDGSWTNVVGLPMEALQEELAVFPGRTV